MENIFFRKALVETKVVLKIKGDIYLTFKVNAVLEYRIVAVYEERISYINS